MSSTWGYDGLAETLAHASTQPGPIAHTARGRDAVDAAAPAVLEVGREKSRAPCPFSVWRTDERPNSVENGRRTAHRAATTFPLGTLSEENGRAAIAREMRGFNRQCDVIRGVVPGAETGHRRSATEEDLLASSTIRARQSLSCMAIRHTCDGPRRELSDRLVLYGLAATP